MRHLLAVTAEHLGTSPGKLVFSSDGKGAVEGWGRCAGSAVGCTPGVGGRGHGRTRQVTSSWVAPAHPTLRCSKVRALLCCCSVVRATNGWNVVRGKGATGALAAVRPLLPPSVG